MIRRRHVCILPFFLALAACGAPDEAHQDETDAFVDPIAESSCLTAASDMHLLNGEGYYWSPTTYDNPKCSKAWIYTTGATLTSPGTRSQVRVNWIDRRRRTWTDCEGGLLRVRVMSRDNTIFYHDDATYSAPLAWYAGMCWYPTFDINSFGGRPDGAMWHYIPSETWLGGTPDIPGHQVPFALEAELDGRKLKLAVQALTPRGSTQAVQAYADFR